MMLDAGVPNSAVVPAKAGTHTPGIFNWNETVQQSCVSHEHGGYGSPPEPVIGPAKPDPLAGTTAVAHTFISTNGIFGIAPAANAERSTSR
jgi:hypothetical protein